MAAKRKEGAVAAAKGETSASSSSLDVAALRQVVEILESSEVTQLEWRRGDERLIIRRGPVPPATPAPAPLPAGYHPASMHSEIASSSSSAGGGRQSLPSASAPAPTAAPSAAEPRPGTVVTSPFVGTFYRTPAPDQPAFVEVGTSVRKGQVLCIIEAMKLMNEIESDVAGRVAEIFAQNGQPVEFGQPLFRIEPA
jgi:acetyl-CoA carboxylase biotin carboxyl carrier protein